MNDQERNELRVKVAECARWLVVDCGGNKMCVIRHGDGPVDPLRDLNACHEFEKLLTQTYPGPYQMTDYVENLKRVVGGVPNCFAQFHATAEQRCRAFVATMEKGEHHGR